MDRQIASKEQVERAIAWYSENRDHIVWRLQCGPWTIGEVTFLNQRALLLLDERIERFKRSQKEPALLDDLYVLRPIRFFYRGLRRQEAN